MKKKIVLVSAISLIILSCSFGIYRYIKTKELNNAEINNGLTTFQTVKITSAKTGTIKELYVKQHDKVKKGQPLALLEYELTSNTENNSVSSVADAKAKLDKAEQDNINSAQMYKDGVIKKEEYDLTVKTLNDAQENYEKLSQEVETTDVSTPDKKFMTTKIYASADGIVNINKIKKGDKVNQGEQIILIVHDNPLPDAQD